MTPASQQFSSYRPHPSAQSRMVSIALALCATGVIIIMLIKVGVLGPRPAVSRPMIAIFHLEPPPPARAPRVVKVGHNDRAAVPKQSKESPPKMVIVSREVYDASDIASLPHRGNAPAEGDFGQDSTSGDGPNGERLYDVDWYTKPTRAELAPYMPAVTPENGSATIACRMIADYHVEDCRELDESPAGSGLSRALRQAAWQFRVRPPRIGNRSILDGWVRIHFSFTEAAQ